MGFKVKDGVLFSEDETVLIQYPGGKTNALYIMPQNVTAIAPKAFYGCSNLCHIVLSPKLERIEDETFALLSSAALSAQDFTTKTLYRTEVYGQTFELIELSNDEGCILCLFMTDNKNTNKSGVTFYDSELPTAYYIFSKYITNSKEYSKTVDACKEFFDVSMNLIYLADMKDICDIAPCCELNDYSVKQFKNGEKYIHIEYNCEDLELLFKIASMYNAKGRAYVLEKYAE